MNKIFLFSVLLALSLFLFGCTNLLNKDTDAQAISYESYSDDYFSVSYPSGWNVEHTLGEDGLPGVEFTSRRENQDDHTLDQMIVEVYYVSEGFNTFEDFESFENRTLYETDELTSVKTMRFKGNDALEISGKGPINDDIVSFTTIYFVEGEYVYRIQYAFESSKEQKFLPTMEYMLETFSTN